MVKEAIDRCVNEKRSDGAIEGESLIVSCNVGLSARMANAARMHTLESQAKSSPGARMELDDLDGVRRTRIDLEGVSLAKKDGTRALKGAQGWSAARWWMKTHWSRSTQAKWRELGRAGVKPSRRLLENESGWSLAPLGSSSATPERTPVRPLKEGFADNDGELTQLKKAHEEQEKKENKKQGRQAAARRACAPTAAAHASAAAPVMRAGAPNPGLLNSRRARGRRTPPRRRPAAPRPPPPWRAK